MAAHKILLVDDNRELLALLARLVEAEGWVAVRAATGQEALDRVAEQPAAGVIDILLPDMMGYEVAVALRKATVPFVFMTGVFKGGRAAVEARAQHGAAAYFEKPFDARQLIDTLRAILPSQPSVREQEPTPPPATDDFDVEVAVEGDEPLEPLELTGKVTVTESGSVSAIIKGDDITVSSVEVPVHPSHLTPPRAQAQPGPPRAPAGMTATEGALADNFPDLITAYYQTQQTGELTVQRGKVKKTVYFEKGRPCFAISNLVTDRLGPFLVRVGKITFSQLELCAAAAEKKGQRTGDVLAEMGLLKETEKIYYVAQQVKAIIYSIFGWEEGHYRLHFNDRAAKEGIKLDLHPANLIVRGVKKLYKPDRLYRLLSPEDRLMPSSQPAYALNEVDLENWEAEMLPRVDGTRTLAELIALAGRPEPAVYGFLYAMVALRVCDRR